MKFNHLLRVINEATCLHVWERKTKPKKAAPFVVCVFCGKHGWEFTAGRKDR